MVKKVLIQVVSVFTLVFGTCYQSVLALADNVGQFEIHSSKVMDKDGKAVERVKAGSTQKLVFDMTINNKDGDKASGTTDVFIPETQLKVMKAKVNATSSIPDAKASLYMEKNRKLRLKWSGVEHTARFTLEVPVEIGNPMTLTDLPVAVDDATSYTQQMIVLAEDAKDDAVSEAITENELPTDLTLQLDNYLKQVEAQKAQQAQQEADDQAQKAQDEADAEAEAQKAEEEEKAAQKKADAEKKKAAEAKKAAAKLAESKKLEAAQEAKEQADAKKEKEQQASDLEKAEEETKDAIENNADKPAAKSSRASARVANGDIGAALVTAGNGATPSFFDKITLTDGGDKVDVSGTDGDALDTSKFPGDFTLTYFWTIDELNKKLGEEGPVVAGDTYKFRVYGLAEGNDASGTIVDNFGKDAADYTVKYVKDSDESYYEISIELTSQDAIDGKATYTLNLTQKLVSAREIVFEYNDEAIVSVMPDKIVGLASKDGKFYGENQIEWKIETDWKKTQGYLQKELIASDISITDTLAGNNQKFKSFG